MPDPLSILYSENKLAQKENRQILGPPQEGPLSVPDWTKPLEERPITFGPESATGIDEISKYQDYLYNPAGIELGVDINKMRAISQPTSEQVGHIATRLIPNVLLGTVQNLSNIADVEDYFNIDDEVGNAVGNIMQDWMDKINANQPIYRQEPNKSWDIGDPGYWTENISNLLNSAGSFVLTGMITGGILNRLSSNISSGALSPKALAKYEARIQRLIAEGKVPEAEAQIALEGMISKHISGVQAGTTVANAIALNQAESIQEGMGVYRDVFNNKVAEGKDIETAKQLAADAAALDVNINRVNILSNLTSAGLFTKAHQALIKNMGGLNKEVISETLQEGLEEGVNYAAQTEAMQQSKDGFRYQLDPERILNNLMAPKGLEQMFMGALGGGIQTYGTHVLTTAIERSQEAVNNLKQTIAGGNTNNKGTAAFNRSKRIDDYFQAKKNASSQEEHDRIDRDYLDEQGKVDYLNGDIDNTINSFSIAANQNVQDISKKTGRPESEVQDEVDRAKIAIDRLNRIKQSGDSVNLSGYLNKEEVLNQKLASDDLGEAINIVNSQIDAAKDSLKKQNPEITEKELDEATSELNSRKIVLGDNKKISDESLKRITSPEFQKELQIKEEKKVQKAEDQKNDEVVQNNRSEILPKAPGIINEKDLATETRPGSSITINNNPAENQDIPHSYVVDGPKGVKMRPSEKFELNEDNTAKNLKDDELSQFDADKDTISIISEVKPNGEKDYLVVKPRMKDVMGAMRGARIYLMDKNNQGKPTILSTIKNLYGELGYDPRASIKIGDSKFNRADIDAFLNSKGYTIDDLTKDDLFEFINSRKSVPADRKIDDAAKQVEKKEKKPVENIISDPAEPVSDINDGEIGDIIRKSSKGEINANPNSIAFLAEQYNFIDGQYIGTGVINEEYLINSDRRHVYAGRNIIIEPYEGEKIPLADYDKNGKALYHNGKRKTTPHNAASAIREGRDIPIAIYLAEKNGEKGSLIGFLRESKWLDEGGPGARKNITNSSESIAQEVTALRSTITDEFRNGNKVSISSKIENISAGHPLINTEGYKSIKDAMPNLIGDAKFNGILPFAHVVNGVVYQGKTIVSNVVNQEMIGREDLTSGRPVILLPIGDGSFYAMPVMSKTVNDSGRIEYVKNGILAHLNIDPKITEKVNKDSSMIGQEIDTMDGLRNYLQQFVYMIPSHLWGDKNFKDRPAITIWDKDGKTMIKYGQTNGASNVIATSTLATMLKSDSEETSNKGKKIINDLVNVIGIMRHNFQSGKLESNEGINLITKSGTVENKNHSSVYMETLQTNAKVAGQSGGKNIYLIQPTITFDLKRDATKEGAKTVTPPEKPTSTTTTAPRATEKKVRPKLKPMKVDGETIELLESNDISTQKASIGIEVVDNTLFNSDPEDGISMGEKLIKYCK